MNIRSRLHSLNSLIFPLLDPTYLKDDGPADKPGWERLHDNFMEKKFNDLKLEDISPMRRWAWGDYPEVLPNPVNTIKKLADKLTKLKGPFVTLKDNAESFLDLQDSWTIISRLVSPGIICAWMWRNRNPESCPNDIKLDSPVLNEILTKGVGDYHIHSGAVGTLNYFLQIIPPNTQLIEQNIESQYLDPDNWMSGDPLNIEYFNPRILRIVHGIVAWLIDFSLHSLPGKKGADLSKLPLPLQNLKAAKRYWKELLELLTLSPPKNGYDHTKMFSRLIAKAEKLKLTKSQTNRVADQKFLCEAMQRYDKLTELAFDNHIKASEYFFNKMIWLRNFSYQFFTQAREGFANFKRWFNRLKYSSREYTSLTEKLDSISSVGNVKKVELRFSIRDFKKNIRERLYQYAAWRGWSPTSGYKKTEQFPKLSFTISFSKEELEEEEIFYNGGARYSHKINEYLNHLNQFMDYAKLNPEILYLVRGLDVCNLERVIPNWVFALLYKHFNKIATEEFYKKTEEIPLYRHTFHAGEDYDSPVSGLRSIYEAVVLGGMEDSFRIGHGIALGLNLKEWEKKDITCYTTLGTRLDDLVWEWHLMSINEIEDRKNTVEKEIREIRNKIKESLPENRSNLKLFESSYDDLFEAYLLRFNYERLKSLKLIEGNEWLERKKCRNIRKRGIPEEIFSDYLCRRELWKAEVEPVKLEIDEECIQRFAALQNYMIGILRYKCIETCPSSNILISGLFDYKEHPIFQLYPPEGEHRLGVSINTDDPLTFNTNIIKEYENIYQAAQQKYPGKLPYEIKKWLEEIIEMGNSYSYYEEEGDEKIYQLIRDSGAFYAG